MPPINCYTIGMIKNQENTLIATHLATGQSVEIDLTDKEMVYATCKDICINECWDFLDSLVDNRTGIKIIDELQIDFIVVNGIKKVFH